MYPNYILIYILYILLILLNYISLTLYFKSSENCATPTTKNNLNTERAYEREGHAPFEHFCWLPNGSV